MRYFGGDGGGASQVGIELILEGVVLGQPTCSAPQPHPHSLPFYLRTCFVVSLNELRFVCKYRLRVTLFIAPLRSDHPLGVIYIADRRQHPYTLITIPCAYYQSAQWFGP